ncbi:MAG: efflux RND transporter permease subunit, partial [Phycisphaerae bacterium]
MLEAIIGWSLRNRLIVIVATLVLVGFGVYAMLRLPIDAFPDTTPVMVQINTVASALTPEEIEQQVTLPLERVVTGLPNLQEVRSVSKFGFCQLTVIFDDDMDLYLARQLVNERVQTAELPDGVGVPELGPISTGLGEVLHYLVTSETRSLNELTTLQDWVIRPQLQTVPGVAEINTWGGERRQFQVFVDPMRLIKHDLTLDRVLEALRGNNMNVGGGNLTQAGELLLVHGVALTTELPQIENIVIDAQAGVPIRVRDVAEVKIGHEIRRGAVTANGKGEVVHGLGFMIMHENAHRVTTALRHRLTEVQKVLPDDVKLELVYDRTELVEKVIETVKKNLLEGGLLVVAILFIFLGNVRAGLIVALAIPLSMLFAFSMMLKFGIAASLLSLGALDFGLVVDSSVILVENSVRKLNLVKGKRRVIDVVRDAACVVRRPSM